MVSFNTIFASAVAVASSLSLVAGAVLPQAQDKDFSIARRGVTETWDEYHATNANFARLGLCRAKIDATDRDYLWPCKEYCKSNSVSCFSRPTNDPSIIHANPNGERWTYGECWCSNPLADIIVKFTAEGLSELPGVTCAVWLEALKLSVEGATWVIPGVGPAAKAAKTIIKSVKLAGKLGGKDGWTNFIKDTCQIEEWDFDISMAFDGFLNADESQLE